MTTCPTTCLSEMSMTDSCCVSELQSVSLASHITNHKRKKEKELAKKKTKTKEDESNRSYH